MIESRFRTGWRVAVPYFRRYRRPLLIGIVFLLATNAFQITIPWLLKTGIDTLSELDAGRAAVQTLMWAAIGIAVAAICQAMSRVGSRWYIFSAGRNIEYDVRQQAYEQILDLDAEYYQTHARGDVISRVSNDIGNVRVLFGFGGLSFVNMIVAYISALSVMLFMSWKLTLLAVMPFPILFFVLKRFGLLLHRRFVDAQESLGDLSSYLQEALHGYEVVKGFAQEDGFFERFQARNQANFDANMRLAWARSFMAPLMIFISGFGIFVVLAAGGYFVIRGDMTIGEFVAFQGYLGMLVWPTLALGWLFNVLERGLASLVRVDELLSTKPVIMDAPDAVDVVLQGDVRIQADRIRVGGDDTSGFALQAIDLHLAPGSRLALVGKTGSGKTSLFRAMMRLLDVPPGTVHYDGTDVTTIRIATLRSQIGYLPQEPFLFGRSIRDALTVGLGEQPEARLWEVMRQAHIAEEIEELPRKLDARLGEKGVSLSGGQRQRLMIARLFLTDPRVVYFDSPLAAMDFVTADLVRDAMQQFCEGRTVFWATHRLERMGWFDRIILLDEGRVIGSGSHEQVLKEPLYHTLFQRQQLMRALEAE